MEGVAGCRGWGQGIGGSGLIGRGSVWDDEEVVAMDGGGRYRTVNVLIATELYPETCLTVPAVCQLHHNRKEVSQEDGASQVPGGQGSCILVLTLMLCALLVTEFMVSMQ